MAVNKVQASFEAKFPTFYNVKAGPNLHNYASYGYGNFEEGGETMPVCHARYSVVLIVKVQSDNLLWEGIFKDVERWSLYHGTSIKWNF